MANAAEYLAVANALIERHRDSEAFRMGDMAEQTRSWDPSDRATILANYANRLQDEQLRDSIVGTPKTMKQAWLGATLGTVGGAGLGGLAGVTFPVATNKVIGRNAAIGAGVGAAGGFLASQLARLGSNTSIENTRRDINAINSASDPREIAMHHILNDMEKERLAQSQMLEDARAARNIALVNSLSSFNRN